MEKYDFAGQNILVLGATGFIGSHLSQALTRHNVNVICTSRNLANVDVERTSRTTWYECDASRREQVAEVINRSKPDIIYQLTSDSKATRDISLIPDGIQNDVMATINVLLEAARVGGIHVVLAGSFEEPTRANEFPCSPYAAAKATSTAYARMVSALDGLQVSILRLMMVYGPRQNGGKVFPYVINKLRVGQVAELGPAQRQLDWIYIDDVVDAFLRVGTAPWVDARPIDIGSGTLMRLRDCVELIGEMMDKSDLLKFGALEERPLEREDTADLTLAKTRLGWQPSTHFRSGLQMTIDSMAKYDS